MKRLLTDIYIYPIKSLGGIRLESAKLEQKGLEHDRRWMLVNDRNEFLTIRQHPEFLFYEVFSNVNGFEVSKKGSIDNIIIPFEIKDGTSLTVKVWDDYVEAIEASESYHQWFTKQLGFNCKLVHMPQNAERRVQPEWVLDEHHVSFADTYPYLIVGKRSLKDLNLKLEDKITMQRFRPNLIFDGGEPYEEYLWKDLEIGEGLMKGIKPCTRCIVITMDPETAIIGNEPLKTLFKQRIEEKMIFGQYVIAINDRHIRIGDEIILNSLKQSPYDPV
jgi:uncharacterized protein YcbX